MQCDALLAEVENKRSYFLADLEYEERIHQNSLEESIKRLEKVLGASQGLQSYVSDVVTSEKAPFLEVHIVHTFVIPSLAQFFKSTLKEKPNIYNTCIRNLIALLDIL